MIVNNIAYLCTHTYTFDIMNPTDTIIELKKCNRRMLSRVPPILRKLVVDIKLKFARTLQDYSAAFIDITLGEEADYYNVAFHDRRYNTIDKLNSKFKDRYVYLIKEDLYFSKTSKRSK